MNPDVGARVSNTKNDFKTAIVKAFLAPKKNKQYMVTIFESPIFTPIGKNGKGGNIDSAKERVSANANKSPNKQISEVLLFFGINLTFLSIMLVEFIFVVSFTDTGYIPKFIRYKNFFIMSDSDYNNIIISKIFF